MTRDKALKLLRLTAPFSLLDVDQAFKTRLTNIHPEFQDDLKSAHAFLEQELKQASAPSSIPQPDTVYQHRPIPRSVPPSTEVKSFLFQHKGMMVALIFFLALGGYFFSGTDFTIRTPPKKPVPKAPTVSKPPTPKPISKPNPPNPPRYKDPLLDSYEPRTYSGPKPAYIYSNRYWKKAKEYLTTIGLTEVSKSSEIITREEFSIHFNKKHDEWPINKTYPSKLVEIRTVNHSIKDYSLKEIEDRFTYKIADFHLRVSKFLNNGLCEKVGPGFKNSDIAIIDLHEYLTDKNGHLIMDSSNVILLNSKCRYNRKPKT